MLQKYINEYVNAGSLKSLNMVLWEWVRLNRELAREWDWKDCPWWYTERASVSILAGAVWNSEGLALEAYSSKKGKGRGAFQGRCDLYFKIGNQDFIGEAKQCWSNAGAKAHSIASIVEAKQKEAYKGIIKTQAERERKLGIVFAVPRIPKSEQEELSERLIHWHAQIVALSTTSIAWVFPSEARKLTADDSYIYPGIAVLIQEVQ